MGLTGFQFRYSGYGDGNHGIRVNDNGHVQYWDPSDEINLPLPYI